MNLENSKRTAEHKRNVDLEKTLYSLENLLGNSEMGMQFNSDLPIVFIMGSPRSGTTLLTQYLAKYSGLNYPTNLLSRFYYSPYIGSQIQKLLVDLDFKGELLSEFANEITFNSNLGKTKGPLAPHEFWYYWRRFFKFGEIQKLDENQMSNTDISGFYNGLKAMQTVFSNGIFLKGMICNWNIPFLYNNMKNVYFIYIKRDLAYNAQSLLESREEYFSSIDEWYSFKPPEYEFLRNKTPYEQVVGQVHYTNKAIEDGLSVLPENQSITLNYEEFCDNPTIIFNKIVKCFGIENGVFDKFSGNEFIPAIQSNNQIRLASQNWEQLSGLAGNFANLK